MNGVSRDEHADVHCPISSSGQHQHLLVLSGWQAAPALFVRTSAALNCFCAHLLLVAALWAECSYLHPTGEQDRLREVQVSPGHTACRCRDQIWTRVSFWGPGFSLLFLLAWWTVICSWRAEDDPSQTASPCFSKAHLGLAQGLINNRCPTVFLDMRMDKWLNERVKEWRAQWPLGPPLLYMEERRCASLPSPEMATSASETRGDSGPRRRWWRYSPAEDRDCLPRETSAQTKAGSQPLATPLLQMALALGKASSSPVVGLPPPTPSFLLAAWNSTYCLSIISTHNICFTEAAWMCVADFL